MQNAPIFKVTCSGPRNAYVFYGQEKSTNERGTIYTNCRQPGALICTGTKIIYRYATCCKDDIAVPTGQGIRQETELPYWYNHAYQYAEHQMYNQGITADRRKTTFESLKPVNLELQNTFFTDLIRPAKPFEELKQRVDRIKPLLHLPDWQSLTAIGLLGLQLNSIENAQLRSYCYEILKKMPAQPELAQA